MQSVSKQRLVKHMPAKMNTWAKMEVRCFRCGPRRGDLLETIKFTSSVVSFKSACEEKFRSLV
jgi:hypothetical protein